MLFCLHGRDRSDAHDLRQKFRPSHKEYLAQIADRIAFAGPLLDDAGEMAGSLLVIDFPDRTAAQEWLENEPFTTAGVYEEMSVTAFQNLWHQRVGFPE